MKVKLEDVLEAMNFVDDDTQYYYDVKNEKVLMIFDGMVDGEDNSELIEEIEDSFIEEYIPLPGQYEINEYRIIDLANAQDIREDKILPLTAKEHDIYWIAIGLCLGIVIGLLIDDIGLGMCLGVMMGVSVGPAIDVLRKNKKSEEQEDNDEKE